MNKGARTNLPIRFAECAWPDFEPAVRERSVLLLPVGSTEPHGPHLPLATDVLISEAMALEAAAELRRAGGWAFVLPSIAYSVTDFARDFPGCVSIRFETARDLVADVCRSLVTQGFRRVCIANSHLEPRHVESLVAAVAAVRDATGVEVVFPDKRRRRWSSRLSEEFQSGACHAGQYEGSVVLAVRPDLVREDVRAALPPVERSLADAIREGKSTFLDAGGDLAYFGRPSEATAAEGDQTILALAEMLVLAARESFDLDHGVHDND